MDSTTRQNSILATETSKFPSHDAKEGNVPVQTRRAEFCDISNTKMSFHKIRKRAVKRPSDFMQRNGEQENASTKLTKVATSMKTKNDNELANIWERPRRTIRPPNRYVEERDVLKAVKPIDNYEATLKLIEERTIQAKRAGVDYHDMFPPTPGDLAIAGYPIPETAVRNQTNPDQLEMADIKHQKAKLMKTKQQLFNPDRGSLARLKSGNSSQAMEDSLLPRLLISFAKKDLKLTEDNCLLPLGKNQYILIRFLLETPTFEMHTLLPDDLQGREPHDVLEHVDKEMMLTSKMIYEGLVESQYQSRWRSTITRRYRNRDSYY